MESIMFGDDMNKPIPEGLQREMIRRRSSLDRLDKIIKLGGAVGSVFPLLEVKDHQSAELRGRTVVSKELKWDAVDLNTKADPATYGYLGTLINKECKRQSIPNPYPVAIDWTFRHTKDRVWTVNTFIWLLVQRAEAEKFILEMKDVVEYFQELTADLEENLKTRDTKITELEEKIADMHPEKEIKKRTEKFHRSMEGFKKKEIEFAKQTEAFQKKEQVLERDLKKLSKDIAQIKKAKVDFERKNKLLEKQKRTLEMQNNKIQKRLTSKFDQRNKKSKVELGMRQIGTLPLFETDEERRARRKRDPQKTTWDFIEEQNENLVANMEKIIAENNDLKEQMKKPR